MRPLRYSINVTLDGCCDHQAIPADEELHRHAIENLERADALLFGRATYQTSQPELRDPPRQLESVGQRRRLHQGAPDPTKQGAGDSTPHVRNFVECIRTLNICREAGRPVLNWAPKVERSTVPAPKRQMPS